jgi:phosphoribosyl-ATP pyrophosphohydrolase/phosphoribosyl-AMP cyclohydrolase/histidinol dehydrogenase
MSSLSLPNVQNDNGATAGHFFASAERLSASLIGSSEAKVEHKIMTSVPYGCFSSSTTSLIPSLTAVGRCRIDLSHKAAFRSIVEKNKQQAMVQLDDSIENETDRNKLQKKFMKEGVAMAKAFMEETLRLDVSIVDVEFVLEASDVIETDGCICACLLDAGCQTIVCQDLEALKACRLPCSRVMGSTVYNGDMDELRTTILQVKEYCSMLSIHLNQSSHISQESISDLLAKLETDGLHIVVHLSPAQCLQEDLHSLVAFVCAALKEGAGTVCLQDPSVEQLGRSFASCLKTDRTDGLYTTVVCTRNGEALGLVYSSIESIVAALECGRGVYYSRSRHGLWRKGDTSGHVQDLHRIDVDCDGDALRFTVTQRGGDCPAFCHLGTLTCWGRPRGLRQLEEVLQERLQSAPEGSYTKRLFDDSVLLRDKLVEEAQELSEAESKQHVAEELADLLYFALVKAAKAGVTLDDAVSELDKRSRKVTRRQGDSKAFRIAAGKEILGKPS